MNKAEVLREIIESRRSIYPKEYSGEKIPEAYLEDILNSAQFAPNHKRTKPWRFKILQGGDLVKLAAELQRLYIENTPENFFLQKKYEDFAIKIDQSDAVIPIVVNYSGLVPAWEETSAVAMAVENMYLTCTAHGVGCYWSSHQIIGLLKTFLNLEENQECIGLFYMGMPKTD